MEQYYRQNNHVIGDIRSALGDAAGLCDAISTDIWEACKPRTKLKVQRAKEISEAVKTAGDAIWAMRDRIKAMVDASNRKTEEAVKKPAIPTSTAKHNEKAAEDIFNPSNWPGEPGIYHTPDPELRRFEITDDLAVWEIIAADMYRTAIRSRARKWDDASERTKEKWRTRAVSVQEALRDEDYLIGVNASIATIGKQNKP